MAPPQVTSDSELVIEPVFVEDENGVPIMAVIAKGTFAIAERPALHDQQLPLLHAGEFWYEGAQESSYKYEPEIAYIKPATDVVLIGHAWAPRGGVSSLDVGLKVGPVQKIVKVFGDRYWVKVGGMIRATSPRPFEKIPLVYERAFGGWDKADRDEAKWTVDRRNPVGRGFGHPLRYVDEGKVPMPNIEDPNRIIRRYGDAPPPAGFGFVSPHWQPGAQYAGTYDEAWEKERKPLVPKDFDRRYFNAASPGLVAPGYLRGDEDVVVVNAARVSPLRFRLPGLPPPDCRVHLRDSTSHVLSMPLDTVIINTDEMLLILLWRAYVEVPRGPHHVLAVEVTTGADRARS